jgi:hypothetical protein
MLVGFGECLMAGVVAGPLAPRMPEWVGWVLFALSSFTVAWGGLIIWQAHDEFPIWLRSKKWAVTRRKEVMENPEHRLHKWYWAESLGFKGITKYQHQVALDEVNRTYEIEFRKPWKNPRLYLVVGVFLAVCVGAYKFCAK